MATRVETGKARAVLGSRDYDDLSFSREELAELRAEIERRVGLTDDGRPRRRQSLRSSRRTGRVPDAVHVELDAGPIPRAASSDSVRVAPPGGTPAPTDALDVVSSDVEIEIDLPASNPSLARAHGSGERALEPSPSDVTADDGRGSRVAILLSALKGPERAAKAHLSVPPRAPADPQPRSSPIRQSRTSEWGGAGLVGAPAPPVGSGGPRIPEKGPGVEAGSSSEHPAGEEVQDGATSAAALKRRTTALRGSGPARSRLARTSTAPGRNGGAEARHVDDDGAGRAREGSSNDLALPERARGSRPVRPPRIPTSPFPLAADLLELPSPDPAADATSPPAEASEIDIDVVEGAVPVSLRPNVGRSSEHELSGDDLEELRRPPPLPLSAPADLPLEDTLEGGSGAGAEEVKLPLDEADDGVITSAFDDDVVAESEELVARKRSLTPPVPPIPKTPVPTRVETSASEPAPALTSERPSVPASGTLSADSVDERTADWFLKVFDEDYLRTIPPSARAVGRPEIDFIWESLAPLVDTKLLDVGCGTGRHCIELAARGLDVTGVDLSGSLIARALHEAKRRAVELELVQQDMRQLDQVERFDAVICMGTTFGYFDDDTNRRCMSLFARCLKPGGRLLLEVANRDYLIRELPTRVGWEGDGCVVLEEVDFSFFNSRLTSKRSVVFMDGRHLEQDISIRLYSLHELGKLMHPVGLRVLEVSGHVAHRAQFFGNTSRGIILLAEKSRAP